MPRRAGAWRGGEASPGTSSPQPALGAARAVPSRAGAGARSMAGLPGTVRPRSGSPGASAALPAPRLAALDGAFVCSPLGGLMGAQAVSTGVPGGGKGGLGRGPLGCCPLLAASPPCPCFLSARKWVGGAF